MTASYLQSDVQKDVLSVVAYADRAAPLFFVVSPFVIDCRADRAAFRSALTEGQITTVAEQYEPGKLRYVGQLHRPGLTYARETLRTRLGQIDGEALRLLDQFLRDWRTEKGKLPAQTGKQTDDQSVGIDILLPVDTVRLSFDSSSLMGIYP